MWVALGPCSLACCPVEQVPYASKAGINRHPATTISECAVHSLALLHSPKAMAAEEA